MPDPAAGSRRAAQMRHVVIVGRHSLQLRVLARIIGTHLSCACEVRQLAELDSGQVPPDALLLLDLDSLPAKHLAAQARALMTGAPERHLVLFNVEDLAALHYIVQWPGVRGIFSQDVSQEHLLKGVSAILAGEYWLPRKVLTAHLEQTRVRRSQSGTNGVALTRKETETLMLLMRGSSNSNIANQLKVSTHTVKTHLYNLFRKIQVRNRVQAAHWAMNHIDHVEGEPR